MLGSGGKWLTPCGGTGIEVWPATWGVSQVLSGLGHQTWGDTGPKSRDLPRFESFRPAGPSQAKSSKRPNASAVLMPKLSCIGTGIVLRHSFWEWKDDAAAVENSRATPPKSNPRRPQDPLIPLLLLLLSRFSRVRLCATQWTAAHQAPPSLGFSKQEHWSGSALSYLYLKRN